MAKNTSGPDDEAWGAWQIEIFEDPKIRSLYRARALGPNGEVIEDVARTVVREDVISIARRTLTDRKAAIAQEEARSRAFQRLDAPWLANLEKQAIPERIEALIEAAVWLERELPADAALLSAIRTILAGWHTSPSGLGRDSATGLFRTLSDDEGMLNSRFGQGVVSILEDRTKPSPHVTFGDTD